MSDHSNGKRDMFAICVIAITVTALVGLAWHYLTTVHR